MERVLKAGREVNGGGRRIAAAEWLAVGRSEAILARAAAEAEQVVRRAAEQAQAVRERAEADGFETGRGRAAAALLAAEEVRREAERGGRREAVALALEMTRRLLRRELAATPAAIEALAADAIGAAGGRRGARLRVRPESAAALRSGGAPWLASCELVEDPGLSPGDAVVETDAGGVDARLEARLEAFRAALEGAAT